MYKVKVLIVEDDFIIATDIDESLKSHDFEITGICTSGEEAIEHVEKEYPDLLIMDIRLNGELDGIEAGAIITEKYNIPIIFLSDYTDRETVQRSTKAFPANFLSKPFNENDLVRAIDIAFHNANAARKLAYYTRHYPYVLLKEGFKYVKIKYKSIIMIKADRAYCTLFTDAEQFTFSKSLNKINKELDYPPLYQTHRSYIINTDKITHILGNIITLGKYQAELSKDKKEIFLKTLKKIGKS